MMRRYDTNGSGKLEKDEWKNLRDGGEGIDANKDNVVTVDELAAHMQRRMSDRGGDRDRGRDGGGDRGRDGGSDRGRDGGGFGRDRGSFGGGPGGYGDRGGFGGGWLAPRPAVQHRNGET